MWLQKVMLGTNLQRGLCRQIRENAAFVYSISAMKGWLPEAQKLQSVR